MLSFDDILNKIGGFGRVQVALYILLGLLGIPCGMQNLGMVFFGASMEHWCEVPALSHLDPKQMQYISAADTDDNQLSSCEYYDLDYSSFDNDTLLSWNRTIMVSNTSKTVQCSSWYYVRSEFKSTVRSQWDLVCGQSYIRALMQTIYMCGFLLGAVSFGIISDRFGRLKVMCLCLLLQIVLAIAATIVSIYWHYVAFTIIRFGVGMVTAGLFTVNFVLVMEIIPPKFRAYTGLFYQGFFAMGFCILPGISFALRDLLYTQLAMTLPTVIFLSYYWFIPESPRWLIQQGHLAEAERILRKIASLNKVPLPESFSLGQIGKDLLETKEEKHQGSMVDVLKKPRLRARLFICSYCWFVCGLTYYGISYSAEELGGDIFLNSLISGLVEFPAYIGCFFIVGHPKIGRKFSMAGSFFVGGISLLVCIPLLVKPEHHIILIILANVGKLGCSAAFAIVYIFTAEIFPTVVRSACVGTCSMSARIGALIAPLVMLLWEYWYGIPYILFGVMALLGGVFTLLLPESVLEVLPETIEDGEMFGTPQYHKEHHLHPDGNSSEAEDDGAEMTLLDGDKAVMTS